MLCEDCGKKEATHIAVHVEGGKKTLLKLCVDCARKLGFAVISHTKPLTEEKILAGFFKESGAERAEPLPKLTCPRCGLSYEEFKQSGRLGCSRCYETFFDSLKDLLRRIHGRNDHVGKVPRSSREKFLARREVKKLQQEIKKAVEKEDFESAAALRDQIKKLELKAVAETKGDQST